MVTTAGSFSSIVSRPPSTSRVTVTASAPGTTLEAKVPWDQPSSAASIWPVWLASSSIACLPMMTSCGCSLSTMAFSSLATASGCKFGVGHDVDGAVGPHGERRAQGFLRGLHAEADGDHFGGCLGFLQTNRFFDRDFVERVHRHLNVGSLDSRAVRLDADLHVVVDHPLNRDEDFHCKSLANRCTTVVHARERT